MSHLFGWASCAATFMAVNRSPQKVKVMASFVFIAAELLQIGGSTQAKERLCHS
jgi:hypothetical protein